MGSMFYERDGATFRLRTRNLNNHEIRELLVGMWLRLDIDDRRDFIDELEHYLTEGSEPSALAQAIRDSGRDRQS